MSDDFLYLSRGDVVSLGISMAEIIETVQFAFLERERGNVEMPPKTGIHTRPDSFVHAMPAYIRGLEAAGLKWIAGYPANGGRGLPYISGLMVLNDSETGLPLVLMDATWLTAERTAAATAVAARYMCSSAAETLAVLGCGVQGHSNTRSLRCVSPGLRSVRAYDTRADAVERFQRWCEAEQAVSCRVCASPEEAVSGADAVVTAGPIVQNPQPVMRPEWLKPGAFVCSLDFDSYLTTEVFSAAAVLASDDVAQLDYYRTLGYFGGVPAHIGELSKIVAGCSPGRRTAEDLCVAVNLGVAFEDVAVAKLIYDVAVARGAGPHLPL